MAQVRAGVRQFAAEACTDGLFFPEGARWFDGRLWFGDIMAARVNAMDADGRVTIAAQFDTPCSGVGLLNDGSVLASLMRRRVLAKVGKDGSVGEHADLAALGCDHINDIISDAQGRTYVDCLAYHMEWGASHQHPDGTLIYPFRNRAADAPDSLTDSIALVETDGSARIVASGLLGPNGLAVSGDGRTLIVAEWRINRLTRFRIEGDGSLVDRETFAETDGLPDGICLDAEGAVWVASPTTGDCTRVLPGGRVVARVAPVGHRVTSCVLGGPDRRTLFLTTDEMPTVGTGRIEAVQVDVPGDGSP